MKIQMNLQMRVQKANRASKTQSPTLKWVVAMVMVTALSSSCWARRGGDDVGNGGGLAEQNFTVALENLEKYAQLCLDLEACQLNEAQRVVLRSIIDTAAVARAQENPLIFVSEKQEPGTFLIGGEMKVAKTGLKPGTPIYINTDMIYSKNIFGLVEPLSISQAVAVLVHELGHHVSKLSHSELDLIGVRVSLMLQNHVQSTPVLPWSPDISAVIVQSPQGDSFPQILLRVGDTLWDLGPTFKASVFCPKFNIPIPILPFPDLQFGREAPLGVMYHNVHWEKSARENTGGDYTIFGNLTHMCDSRNVFMAVNSFRMRISFQTALDAQGTPVLVQNSLRLEQSYEPWYKLIQLPR